MQAPFRDRHIISILSALVLHVFVVLLLGLVDLDRELSDDKRLGPVAVRFEPLPPEMLPQPAEPEPEERPQSAEPQLEDAPEAAQNQAPPAAAQDRQQSDQPASQAAQAPPAAEPEQQQSEGSRIVYGEEEQPGESGAGQSSDEAAPAETQPEQSSVFSEELRQELESVQRSGQAAGTQGRATGETGTTGQTRGSGQGQTGPASTEGSSPVDFEIEGPERTLESYSLPQLTEEELDDLPGRIEIVVSFKLPPNGRPTDLNTESGSVYPEIVQKVMQAVRTWTFSEAPEGSDTVNGRARIIIRAAN